MSSHRNLISLPKNRLDTCILLSYHLREFIKKDNVMERKSQKKAIADFIMTLTVIFLLLLCSEFFLRWQYKSRTGISFNHREQLFSPDKNFLYRPTPGYTNGVIDISKRSFREPLSDGNPTAKNQIGVIGSSESMASSQLFNKTYLGILADILKEKDGVYTYPVNAAVGGSNSTHMLKWFGEHVMKETNLKVLIIFAGWTDIVLARDLGEQWNPDALEATGVEFTKAEIGSLTKRALRFCYEHSALASYLRQNLAPKLFSGAAQSAMGGLYKVRFDKVVNNDRVFLNYESNLKKIIELCQNKNVTVLLVQLSLAVRKQKLEEDLEAYRTGHSDEAYNGFSRWSYLYLNCQDRLHSILNRLAETPGVFIVPFNKSLEDYPAQERMKFFSDLVHLTEEGHEKLGNEIYKTIINNNIIGKVFKENAI